MSKGKGPAGRVPFSPAVKKSLAFVGIMFGIAGAAEWYMLANPDEIAPISWAFWWLRENAPWLPAVLGGVGGAFYSHFFWYRRPTDFWHPLTLISSAVIVGAVLGVTSSMGAWRLVAFQAALMAGAGLAHLVWYRLENFDEHRAQFHDED